MITLDVGGTSADIGLAQRRQAAHEAPARHARRPLPGDDPDGRRRHDRSRRRLDRLRRQRRHLPLRPALGGRRARARPPTAAAAPSRPPPTRWSTSAGCCPRSSWAAAMELRPDLARRAFEPWPRRSGCPSRRRRWGRSRSPATRWSSRSRRTRSARASTRATSRSSPRAGPARCSPRTSRLEVGTPAVIVPPYPGVTAALGLLATDSVYEYVATTYQRMSTARTPQELQERFAELEEQARAQLEQRRDPARAVGHPARSSTAATWARATSCASTPARAKSTTRWVGRSGGRVPRRPRARVLASLRGAPTSRSRTSGCAASGSSPPLQMPEVDRAPASRPRAALRHEREAWFRVDGDLRELPTGSTRASSLLAGNRVDGPGDDQPVRLDHGHPAGVIGRDRSLRQHRHLDRQGARSRRHRRRRRGRRLTGSRAEKARNDSCRS